MRMPHPVVGHLDAGERGMTVEDDAEEVVGLPLVPVGRRVYAGSDRMCGSASGAATSTRIRRLWVIDISGYTACSSRSVSSG